MISFEKYLNCLEKLENEYPHIIIIVFLNNKKLQDRLSYLDENEFSRKPLWEKENPIHCFQYFQRFPKELRNCILEYSCETYPYPPKTDT